MAKQEEGDAGWVILGWLTVFGMVVLLLLVLGRFIPVCQDDQTECSACSEQLRDALDSLGECEAWKDAYGRTPSLRPVQQVIVYLWNYTEGETLDYAYKYANEQVEEFNEEYNQSVGPVEIVFTPKNTSFYDPSGKAILLKENVRKMPRRSLEAILRHEVAHHIQQEYCGFGKYEEERHGFGCEAFASLQEGYNTSGRCDKYPEYCEPFEPIDLDWEKMNDCIYLEACADGHAYPDEVELCALDCLR